VTDTTSVQEATKPKTTLMQRIDDRLAIWQAIRDMDGELTPFIESWLAEVEKSLAVKVDGYKFLQDELKSEGERLREEAKRITAAARTIDAMGDALQERIKLAMQKMETDEIVGKVWRYKLSNTAPALVIDASKLPEEFKLTVVTKVPDRDRIKPLLEMGETIAGCELRAGKSLRTYVVKGAK